MTVTVYLEQVRAALADVPPGEREELLADVESSLAAGEGSPEERLGSAQAFAAELRLAAGLEPAAPSAKVALSERARSLARRAPEFAPLWWVIRAYIAVAAVGLLIGATWPDRPVHFLPMLHSGTVTIVVCAIALVLSLWLGRRRFVWLTALNALLLLAAIPVAVHDIRTHAWQTPTQTASVVVAAPVEGLALNGAQVQNVYAYDRAGRLLHDVRLYDQNGNPLDVGAKNPEVDPLRRIVRARGGAVVLNAFPIRYFEPGTRRIAHPNAAPKRRVPKLR